MQGERMLSKFVHCNDRLGQNICPHPRLSVIQLISFNFQKFKLSPMSKIMLKDLVNVNDKIVI